MNRLKLRGGEHQGKGEQGIELCVFLFLVVPSMAVSFFTARQVQLSFVLTATSTILLDLALMGLVLYFLWKNRESLDMVGLVSHTVWLDVVLGLVLFFPVYLSVNYLERALNWIGLSSPKALLPFLVPRGTGQKFLAFLLVTVVAVTEETVFRGYLIHRFSNITGSPAVAVLVSSVIFSLGHGYQGPAALIVVFLLGVIFSLIFLIRKNLVAPIIMHFLQDFVGILILPVMAAGL
jgi:membrane protease YdiL (CAAX protease family)